MGNPDFINGSGKLTIAIEWFINQNDLIFNVELQVFLCCTTFRMLCQMLLQAEKWHTNTGPEFPAVVLPLYR